MEPRNGGVGGGATVPDPAEAERNAVQGPADTVHPPDARTLRLPLAKLDAAPRCSRDEGPVDVLAAVGPPLRRRRDEERERERRSEEVLAPESSSSAHDRYRSRPGKTAKGTLTWLTNKKKTHRPARTGSIPEHVTADDPPRPPRRDPAARTAGDAVATARHGRAVHEESVIDDLLRDLAGDPVAVLPGPEDARPSGRA